MDRLDGLLAKLRDINLSGEIADVRPVFKGFGASCDVFVGFCRPIRKKVAVKRLRVFMSREEEFAKRFFKELYIWSKLDHPNVLPLLGYFIEDGELPNLVSEWMERGTLHDYMKNVVSNDQKLAMVIGIASGLCHLHMHEVIHADLKSHNVLISSSGEPLLTDFGVSHMIACSLSAAGGTTSNLSSPKGTVRWMAKELFQSDEYTDPQPHSKTSDVWAFGMVIYELLSQETPYPHLKTDMQVMFAISRGILPTRPTNTVKNGGYDVDDELWKLSHLCWNSEPSARPTVENIIILLNQ
ncbi:kinase-like protein, partial [Schizopora paradoxa]